MEQEKKKKFIINIIYYTVLAVFVYMGIRFGLPLFTPFIVAFLIAWMLKHPAYFIAKKFNVKQKTINLIVVALFYFLSGILVLVVGSKLFIGFRSLVFQMPELYRNEILPFLESVFQMIEEMLSKADPIIATSIKENFNQFIGSLGEIISGISISAVKLISGYASGLPSFFIKMVLMIVTTFFFAADYEKVTGFLLGQLPDKGREMAIQTKTYVVKTIVVYIRAYTLIMGITFIELCIGLSILAIPYAIPAAVIIAFFDALPAVGTGTILIPLAIIAASYGNPVLATGFIILYLVITVIRNIIEPRIVGKQIGLHPLVALISMFVGVRIFGIVGLFGLPITLSFLWYLNKTEVIHIFNDNTLG